MAAGLTEGGGDVGTEARAAATPPAEVAAIACGMDRMAVRMAEPLEPVVAATTAAIPAQAVRAHAARAPAAQLPHGVGRQYDAVRSSRRTSSDLPIRGRRRERTGADRQTNQRRCRVGDRGGSQVAVHCVQDGAKELRLLP